MSRMITIAVDAMGGDGSPKKIIDGITHHFKNTINVYYKIFVDKEMIEKFITKRAKGINPFDPEQVDVSVKLIAPNGEEIITHGFYYLPYFKNPFKDLWVADTTSFKWRVRFGGSNQHRCNRQSKRIHPYFRRRDHGWSTWRLPWYRHRRCKWLYWNGRRNKPWKH